MEREQVRAIFEEMAAKSTCPKCKRLGMHIVWRVTDEPVMAYPLSGLIPEETNEIPHLECPHCGISADGNVPL